MLTTILWPVWEQRDLNEYIRITSQIYTPLDCDVMLHRFKCTATLSWILEIIVGALFRYADSSQNRTWELCVVDQYSSHSATGAVSNNERFNSKFETREFELYNCTSETEGYSIPKSFITM